MKGVRYLILRGEIYWFRRKVPQHLKEVEPRKFIKISLKTTNFNEAVLRLAEVNEKIEQYFRTLVLSSEPNGSDRARYENAIKQAQLLGFPYQGVADISGGPLSSLQDRLDVVAKQLNNKIVVESVLGGVDEPSIKISNCFNVFYEISKSEIRGKNSEQIRNWRNTRKKSLQNLIDVIGDKNIAEVSRNDALAFRNYWLSRLTDEAKAANTANKEFGHLQRMFRTVLEHYRLPFDPIFSGLRFPEKIKTPRLPFTSDFITNVLLADDALPNLSRSGVALIHLMADTGARPSELIGAADSDVFLDAPVPYVHIKENDFRTLKTRNSEREVPLIGYSLRAARNGAFEELKRYRHKPLLLASVIAVYFKRNSILPSRQYSLYSLRHSFEDRMTAADVPERIKAQLMGHQYARPSYGLGGDLALRQKWMKKFALKR